MRAMFGWFSDASVFGFALKPREPVGVRANDVGQDLDRDLAVQLRVAARDTPRPSRLRRSGR